MSSSPEGPASSPSPRPYATFIACDHAIDSLVTELATSAREPDLARVTTPFRTLSALLVAHMDAEEGHILPLFTSAHAAETRALRRDHDELRLLLDSLRKRIDACGLQLSEIDELQKLIHAHAAREEAVLYPWMEHCLPLDVWNGIRNHFVADTTTRTGAAVRLRGEREGAEE